MTRERISDEKNSICSILLNDLDLKNWWTDQYPGSGIYLHVRHKYEDTVHRVRCECSDKARIEMIDGKLYWLFTEIKKERKK